MSCDGRETLCVVSILGDPRDPRTSTHAPSTIIATIEGVRYPVAPLPTPRQLPKVLYRHLGSQIN